jgi:uncharacterized protein (TIGR03437 family)
VVNAASWDPITASVAPGELITLFGTNLAAAFDTNIGGQPFGTALGGTQVLVNSQPAPVYYVSPTQVSAIIPYEVACANSSTVFCYADIQVNNIGQGLGLSNQVSVDLTDAESGIFSQNQNGIGDAIAEHANGTLITQNSPAAPGETIVLALTGMGAVTPTIEDGEVPPAAGPLSYANNYTATDGLLVLFNDYTNNVLGQQATVGYGGLYPGLAGLYQMNVTVPTNVGPGDVYIEVVTDAADVNQVTVCVTGSCPVSDAALAAKTQARPMRVAAPKLLEHAKGPLHTAKPDARIARIAPSSLAPALRPPAVPLSSPSSLSSPASLILPPASPLFLAPPAPASQE